MKEYLIKEAYTFSVNGASGVDMNSATACLATVVPENRKAH